jgi:membrane-associated phospholipid phosphatase
VSSTEPEATTKDRASRLADGVSVASDFGAIWVLACIAQVVVGRRRPSAAIARLGAAGVTSLVLTRSLKHYFGAPPRVAGPTTTLARTPRSPGFPSGHTLAAFTSALTVPRTSRGRLAALGFATLVAWSRVKVGHHRTSDVVAGAGAGALAGAAVRGVLARVAIANA